MITKRDKLVHCVDEALEAVMFIMDSEMLTVPEMAKLGEIQDVLRAAGEKCAVLVEDIEKRKNASTDPIVKALIDGPVFSWGAHDIKAKRRKQLDKLRALEARIEKVQSEILEEDVDESFNL